jgi:hypothetical protein
VTIIGGLLALLFPPGRLRHRHEPSEEHEPPEEKEPPAPPAAVDPTRRELRYGGVDEDVTFDHGAPPTAQHEAGDPL